MRTYENNQSYGIWKGLRIAGYVLLGLIGAVALAFLFGYFVMLLWNFLMPSIFSLGEITFLQAVGIIILARLIFGGFKHGGHDHHNYHKKWKSKKNHHKDYWGKWKYYDEFWKQEGEQAFNAYVHQIENKDAKNDE